jgi:general secretion pathway protein G
MKFADYLMSLRRVMSNRRRVSGMTLVELMLVVAIIGVLVAIAVPRYNNYRDRVDQSQAINDITVLQAAIKLYAVDSGAYPASLADVKNDGKLDPWGRPYVYQELASVNGHGKARKDHKLNPINSDFDLYSVGKDGVSKTQLTNKESLDDIVRARDGAFVGLATDFVP